MAGIPTKILHKEMHLALSAAFPQHTTDIYLHRHRHLATLGLILEPPRPFKLQRCPGALQDRRPSRHTGIHTGPTGSPASRAPPKTGPSPAPTSTTSTAAWGWSRATHTSSRPATARSTSSIAPRRPGCMPGRMARGASMCRRASRSRSSCSSSDARMLMRSRIGWWS